MNTKRSSNYLLVITLLLITAILLITTANKSWRLRFFSFFVSEKEEISSSFSHHRNNKDIEITLLRQKTALLSLQILNLQEQLKSLTEFRENFSIEQFPQVIPATILAKNDSSSLRESFLIDRGKIHGITAGAPVIFGRAFVGKVWEVERSVSRVMYVTDPQMRSRVKLVTTLDGVSYRYGEGVCIGRGDSCELSLIEKNYFPWKEADIIISFSGGSYPVDLLVGKVQSGYKGSLQEKDKAIGLFWDLRFQPQPLEHIQTVLVLMLKKETE